MSSLIARTGRRVRRLVCDGVIGIRGQADDLYVGGPISTTDDIAADNGGDLQRIASPKGRQASARSQGGRVP